MCGYEYHSEESEATAYGSPPHSPPGASGSPKALVSPADVVHPQLGVADMKLKGQGWTINVHRAVLVAR